MLNIRITLLTAAMGVLLLSPPGNAVVEDPIQRRTDTQKFVGLGGYQFLKISQGARAVGMGDAYTAVADDINAIFWNPAGLTEIRGTAWTATYTRWLVDSYTFSAAFALNTGTDKGGVLGASVIAFRTGDIQERTIFQPQGTGQNISAGDLAIGAVYARKLTNKFSFGSRVSWINQTLHTESINSVVIDVGTRFFTGYRSLRVAMSLKNFGPDKTVNERKFFTPLYYNVAVAAEVHGEKGDPSYLTLTGETAFAADYEMRAHTGAELWLQNLFALRAGYKFNYDTDAFSVGVGLNYQITGDRSVTVDVSYSDMGTFFRSPIRLTVGGTF